MKKAGKKIQSLAAATLFGLPLILCAPAKAQPHDQGAPDHRPPLGQPHGDRPAPGPDQRPDLRPDQRPGMKGGENFRHEGRGPRPDHDGRFVRGQHRPDRDGKFGQGNRGHNRGNNHKGKFSGRDHRGPDFGKMDDRAPHDGPAGHRPPERRN